MRFYRYRVVFKLYAHRSFLRCDLFSRRVTAELGAHGTGYLCLLPRRAA